MNRIGLVIVIVIRKHRVVIVVIGVIRVRILIVGIRIVGIRIGIGMWIGIGIGVRVWGTVMPQSARRVRRRRISRRGWSKWVMVSKCSRSARRTCRWG